MIWMIRNGWTVQYPDCIRYISISGFLEPLQSRFDSFGLVGYWKAFKFGLLSIHSHLERRLWWWQKLAKWNDWNDFEKLCIETCIHRISNRKATNLGNDACLLPPFVIVQTGMIFLRLIPMAMVCAFSSVAKWWWPWINGVQVRI